jgi:hypothetical protein
MITEVDADDPMAATQDVYKGEPMVVDVDGTKIPKVMVEVEGAAEDVVSDHRDVVISIQDIMMTQNGKICP